MASPSSLTADSVLEDTIKFITDAVRSSFNPSPGLQVDDGLTDAVAGNAADHAANAARTALARVLLGLFQSAPATDDVVSSAVPLSTPLTAAPPTTVVLAPASAPPSVPPPTSAARHRRRRRRQRRWHPPTAVAAKETRVPPLHRLLLHGSTRDGPWPLIPGLGAFTCGQARLAQVFSGHGPASLVVITVVMGDLAMEAGVVTAVHTVVVELLLLVVEAAAVAVAVAAAVAMGMVLVTDRLEEVIMIVLHMVMAEEGMAMEVMLDLDQDMVVVMVAPCMEVPMVLMGHMVVVPMEGVPMEGVPMAEVLMVVVPMVALRVPMALTNAPAHAYPPEEITGEEAHVMGKE
uniref:Uncharacterized protein n=1 Tax=Oryza barthii TaxID=65489 RepID=A0A0D3GPC2_9ORYZ